MNDQPTVTAVAAAVAACPAVAGLHQGPVGSYLPGHRVPGVNLDGDTARIVVDLAYPATVADLVTQVRSALAGLIAGPVDIDVADVVLPGETAGDVQPVIISAPPSSPPPANPPPLSPPASPVVVPSPLGDPA